jgi:excisionase family DNA binding protein
VAEKEFFSFEEALHELRLKEEELKRLVSEGEIRAFRDGETMKLRKQDVEVLRSELSGGEVVDLGGASEELVFDDDTDLDAGMATEEISEADTILEDDVEDIGELELDDEELDLAPAPSTRRTTAVGAGRASAAEEEEEEPIWMRAAMIATSFVLVLALPVCIAAASGNVTDIAAGIAGIFAEMP